MAEVDGWKPVKPLEKIVMAAYKKAVEENDMQAINHFADRLDGKPKQDIGGGMTLQIQIEKADAGL